MNPYAIIAGLVVSIGLTLGGVQVGRKLERSAWQAKEIQTLAANAEARNKLIATNEALRQKYAADMRVASEAHSQEIDAINTRHAADLSKRVRVPASFCTSRATDPKGQGASAGSAEQDPAADQFLPDAFASDLRQLAADADEQVADLRQLVTATRSAGCFEGYD